MKLSTVSQDPTSTECSVNILLFGSYSKISLQFPGTVIVVKNSIN